MGRAGDDQTGPIPPFGLQIGQFGQELLRIHHHTAPDDAHLPGVEHPRGKKVEYEFFRSHDDRVPGIGPPLVTGHHFHSIRQGVHHSPLSFVSPLGSDDDFHSSLHACLLLMTASLRSPTDDPGTRIAPAR